MALPTNFGSSCAISLSTNIQECGSVAVCQAIPLEVGDLTNVYLNGANYRVMGGLLEHDFEIRMCQTVQNGLYDFLMSNKVNMSKRLNFRRIDDGLKALEPFVMARQYAPINDEYWSVNFGEANGQNWEVQIESTTGIPIDARQWPTGQRVYIDGLSAGGSATKTAWMIVSVTTFTDNTATLILSSQNTMSALNQDKVASPVTGVMVRGTANIDDFESWCHEDASYINWSNVPFWFETKRNALCTSSNYRKYKAALRDNPLFQEFGDLSEIEKNKQLGMSFQKKFVHDFFWSKPLPYQTLAQYNSLAPIDAYDGSALGLGTDGGTCQGFKANSVGVYEQLATCNRIADLQGAQLQLLTLFNTLYNISRVRQQAGKKHNVIDIFTDSVTADAFNTSMVSYYQSKLNNSFRTTMAVDTGDKMQNSPLFQPPETKDAEFGFAYRSYRLQFPNITINVLTHFFFDDYYTAQAGANQPNVGRVLWILDFTGIYPGILSTNKIVNKTGDLKTLASINDGFRCVLKVPTKESTLMSVTTATVVDCPLGNLIIENFAGGLMDATTFVQGAVYPSGGATTTTTTFRHD
jgi:hypothetical protein